jgi:hypothetical protein
MTRDGETESSRARVASGPRFMAPAVSGRALPIRQTTGSMSRMVAVRPRRRTCRSVSMEAGEEDSDGTRSRVHAEQPSPKHALGHVSRRF